jgi:hypothetical protein
MRVTATMVASVVVFFIWVLVFGFVRGGVSLIACRGENLIFLKKTWRGVRVVLG